MAGPAKAISVGARKDVQGDERLMTRPGRYLCGCNPDKMRNYFTSIDPVTEIANSTRFDDAGNQVCPEHGEPLYGFRSPLVETPLGGRLDYSNMGRDKKSLKLTDPSEYEDRRDNRDPVQVYSEIAASRRASGNGHSHTPTAFAHEERPEEIDIDDGFGL